MTQDTRRAIRTGVHTLGALVMIGLLTWSIHLLKTSPQYLAVIAMGLIAIMFIREVFHGVENSVARFKFSAGKDGISGEAERGEVHEVADAAEAKADEISERN